MGQSDTGHSDAAICAAIASGSADALRDAYRRHAAKVFSLALQLSANRAAAEDTVQEVFLHLWRNAGRFDASRGNLGGFLLVVTRSRAVERFRRDAARSQRELCFGRIEEGCGGARLDSDLDLRAAVGSLPTLERQAILLAYVGGYSYREVARLLDQPEGTIKSRIRSGLRRLRRSLEAGPRVRLPLGGVDHVAS
jgi:RNA polymerase sigma-70 factor (ECF subfamily)